MMWSMRARWCWLAAGVWGGLVCGTPAVRGDVPRVLTYQGRLEGFTDETVDLHVAFYDAATGGSVLYTEAHTVQLHDGVFSLELGSAGGVPDGAFNALDIFVGLSVDAGPELTPRQRLGMTPFAAKSASAERLVIPGAFTPALTVDAQGRLGFGTLTPADAFEIRGGALRLSRDAGQFLQLVDNDATGAVISSRSLGINRKPLIVQSLHDGVGTPGGETTLRFRVGDAAAPREALIVKENGNVGIGNLDPTEKVAIRGSAVNSSATLLQIDDFATQLGQPGGATAGVRLQATRDLLFGTDPVSTFELRAEATSTNGRLAVLEQGEATGAFSFRVGGAETMWLDADGLAIGTTAPSSPFHVQRNNGMADGQFLVNLTNLDPQGAQGGVLLLQGGSLSPNSRLVEARDFNGVSAFTVDGTRNVGVQTSTPTHPLDVDGAVRMRGNTATNLLVGGSNDDIDLAFIKDANTTPAARIRFNGYASQSEHRAMIQFFTRGAADSAPVERARVGEDGNLEVFGRTITNVLEIRGGSDLAESFDVEPADADGETIVPRAGAVVCIDASRPGGLRVSDRAYDATVAGVISGANGVNAGMVMGQAGTLADGAYPVALTGRVWTWCDATPAAIGAGDLLTTSATPGHAMRATDAAASHGAIIGKAMTELRAGRGLVLVLVNLQ